MKRAIAIGPSRSRYCAMESFRHQVRRVTWLVCLTFALSLAALAQASASAPLSADAQAAIKKGLIAARKQEWMTAIQNFQEARKAAPDSPVVFYDLGLAESKISGRELRAIAWFGAYLSVDPNAPNAAAVKEQIEALNLKGKSSLSRVIQSAQDQASQTHFTDDDLAYVAGLWAEADDMTAALKTVDLIQSAGYKDQAQSNIAEAQVRNGDVAGAQKTAALIQEAKGRSEEQLSIANAELKAGDVEGAQNTIASALKTADQIQDSYYKSLAQVDVATSQVGEGDIAGAKATLASALITADLILGNADAKADAQVKVAEAQTKSGDIAGAKATLESALETANQAAGMKGSDLLGIAKAQAYAGDFVAALKTADLIQEAETKDLALDTIAEGQAKGGDITGALKTADLIQGAQMSKQAVSLSNELYANRAAFAPPATLAQVSARPIVPIIGVSDWLEKLDGNSTYVDCQLNTDPFLDLAGYLRALPPSDDPSKLYDALRDTAEKLVRAQSIIDQMLKKIGVALRLRQTGRPVRNPLPDQVAAKPQVTLSMIDQCRQATNFLNNNDGAATACSTWIRLEPNNAEAFYNIGFDSYRKSLNDQAIADFTKAIELKADYADAYFKRGQAYMDKGLYDQAIVDLTKAIALKPGESGYYLNRGSAYEKKGLRDEAIADYRATIPLDTGIGGITNAADEGLKRLGAEP